jgi:NAD(P)-dependent dehydrogenase (short-subunit alcohol dehydrogenase family)
VGAKIIGTGRDAYAMAETDALLNDLGGDYKLVALDVRDEDAVARLFESLNRVDVCVNNAGIARIQPLLDTPTSELREILDVNVVGAFVVMREAARKMVAQGGGTIINIASDAAIKGIGRMAPYVASKHALLGMGRSASLELRASGVRVTTSCPGPIATDIFGPGTSNSKAMPSSVLARTLVHIAGLPPEIEIQEMLVEPMPF